MSETQLNSSAIAAASRSAVAQPTEAAAAPKADFRQHILALDGMRGVAILAVFFYHYAAGAGLHTTSSAVRAAATVFGLGWSGVDMFFVLSGFLITGILFDTLSDPGYYKKFYARRALRIFPVYYLLALIFILLTPVLGVHWSPAHLFFLAYLGYPAALIWPGLVQVSHNVAITHLWSLSVEEQFYMIWPFLIAKLRNPKSILRACMFAGVLALLLRIGVYAAGSLSFSWAYTFLLCRMDTIAIGAAIAILMRGPAREKLQSLAPYIFFGAAIGIVAICVARKTVDHSDTAIGTIGFTLLAIMFGGLLVLVMNKGSWLAGLFSLPVLRMFGKYSYGFYLFHFPLWVALGPSKDFFVARMHSYFIGATFHVFFCLVVNLLVAVASFHLFESPIMRLKGRFSYA
jgi:peptidoglycan/LPS O-acetylase OafA/YrhL